MLRKCHYRINIPENINIKNLYFYMYTKLINN